MSRALRRRYGRARIPRIGVENPRGMSAAAINKELDRLDEMRSVSNDALIAAGRGHETWADTERKSPLEDDLTLVAQAISARRRDLVNEVQLRAGPNMYRLPKGFGPRRW